MPVSNTAMFEAFPSAIYLFLSKIALGYLFGSLSRTISKILLVFAGNNLKKGEKKKEKHGWDLDLEEALRTEAKNEELQETRGEQAVKEDKQVVKERNDYDEIANTTAHRPVSTEAVEGSPPGYETVAEINNRGSKSSDSADEIKTKQEIDINASHADAPQAYANAAAEASVKEDEKDSEESAL